MILSDSMDLDSLFYHLIRFSYFKEFIHLDVIKFFIKIALIFILLSITGYYVLYHTIPSENEAQNKSISIFVLGDIGHSPRMRYHARSFSSLQYKVKMSGYVESDIPRDMLDDSNIEIVPIQPIKNQFNIPFVAFSLYKVVHQIFQLLNILSKFGRTKYILIQNPPSLPILLIVLFYRAVFSCNTQVIIDWHNLNYSILALKYGKKNHPFVSMLRIYEKYLSKFADLNFTVTENMRGFLISEFNLKSNKVLTLYDRPGDIFLPSDKLDIQKKDFFSQNNVFKDIDNISKYRFLVSATSFTPDEDLFLLLDSLLEYDQQVLEKQLPSLFVFITGKGPMKEIFLKKLSLLKFKHIIVKTAWLSFEDYAKVLAFSDLGISLHTSSSGLDLPMKILDYFGSGIPVISLNFPSVSELVKDGSNGFITHADANSKSSVSTEICKLLVNAFSNNEVYNKIKLGAKVESLLKWDTNWEATVGKIFS